MQRQQHGGTVAAAAKIASFAPEIVASDLPFAVVDAAGKTLGEIWPRAVIDLLAGRDQAESAAVSEAILSDRRHAPINPSCIPHGRIAIGLGVVVGAFVLGLPHSRWLPTIRRHLVIPFAEWISAFMNWLKVTFTWLTRSLVAVVNVPLQIAFALLAKRLQARRRRLVDHAAAAVMDRHHARRWRCSAMRWAASVWRCSPVSASSISPLFRQWDSAMLTLALIVVCVPICVVTGLLVGIWGYLSPRANQLIITPALDLMQTIPTFAYLIPMLLLFGTNPVSALLATGLFATPPMVRATMLGSRAKCPPRSRISPTWRAARRRQKMWRVLVPAAKPSLMLGVNQVIMLSLNMVIISSMIGAGGLGQDVLLALRALKVGPAMEAGLCIVVLPSCSTA